jgi:hypothetical protein
MENINLLNIKSIYDINNYTSTNFIKNKISEYIHLLSNINYQHNKNIFIGFLDKYNYNINGTGLFIKNNILIEGDIKNNNFFDSKCNFIFNNSTNIVFDGSIINNTFKNGTLIYDNIKLQGEFLDGLPHNLCTFENNFIKYNGNWLNGKRYGYGIYQNLIDNNKTFKYEGDWFNNLFDGIGILYNDNTIYNGGFIEGKKHGSGTLLIDENAFYVEYNNNQQILKLNSEQKIISDLTCINKKLNIKLKETNNIIYKQENLILEYNFKMNKLEKENRKMEETFLCKVCFKNIPNIVLCPCNHVCICNECVRQLSSKKCPICRIFFRSTTVIYIS